MWTSLRRDAEPLPSWGQSCLWSPQLPARRARAATLVRMASRPRAVRSEGPTARTGRARGVSQEGRLSSPESRVAMLRCAARCHRVEVWEPQSRRGGRGERFPCSRSPPRLALPTAARSSLRATQRCPPGLDLLCRHGEPGGCWVRGGAGQVLRHQGFAASSQPATAHPRGALTHLREDGGAKWS